jgi:hypothetical protein
VRVTYPNRARRVSTARVLDPRRRAV